MYRTILAYTVGRGDLAEEAGGEAFSRAAARTARLRDPVAWLYRVAFNVANDELRCERRDDVGVSDTVQQPPDLSEVLEALKRLPPRERAVMALFYVLDLRCERWPLGSGSWQLSSTLNSSGLADRTGGQG